MRVLTGASAFAGILAPAVVTAQADKLDNFQMRDGTPTQLKQVAPDL